MSTMTKVPYTKFFAAPVRTMAFLRQTGRPSNTPIARELKESFCQYRPHLRAYALTANRGKIKRDALVTPTQLSPPRISA